MVPYKKLFAVSAILMGLSNVAYAAGNSLGSPGREIFTPTLQKADTEVFTCRVVNTGKRPNAIDIVILGSKGTPLETQKSVTLAPGATTSDISRTKNMVGYCKVTAKSSPNDVLVTLCTQAFANGPCQVAVTGE